MERRENQLRVLMGVYAVIYLVFGVALLVHPQGIIRILNRITDSLGLGSPLLTGPHPFWSIVSVSLLFTLALICFLAYRDISNRQLVWIMIFAKYVSAVCLVGYMALGEGHPPGFGLGAIVDATLGTVALVFALRARPA